MLMEIAYDYDQINVHWTIQLFTGHYSSVVVICANIDSDNSLHFECCYSKWNFNIILVVLPIASWWMVVSAVCKAVTPVICHRLLTRVGITTTTKAATKTYISHPSWKQKSAAAMQPFPGMLYYVGSQRVCELYRSNVRVTAMMNVMILTNFSSST